MKTEKKLNLYLIRHGESKMNKIHIIQGQKRFPLGENDLTKKGVEQIKKLVPKINGLEISTIFSSDLERCQHTCEILNEKIKVPIIFSKELREQNCGKWEGKNSKDIFTSKVKENIKKEIGVVPPGGESLKKVEERAINLVEKVKQKCMGTNIIFVTHAAVIQAIVGYYLHILIDYRFRMKPNQGSIIQIIFKEGSAPQVVI